MPPAPITHLENGLSSTGIFRGGWDVGHHPVDPKVVGSHLPLSKRNSTPVVMNGSNHGGHHHHNPLKVTGSHFPIVQNPMVPTPPSTVAGCGGESPGMRTNPHRVLDRCYSEPVKAIGSPQGQQTTSDADLTSSSRYKTELCRPFAETGLCKYGEKCQFAHGIVELRNMPRHPKYKTELCRTFHTTGLCGYGTRCHFIHNADERRNPSPHQQAFGTPLRNSEDSTDLTPQQLPTANLSPPASLHGSPTSPAGAFFGDTFSFITPPHTGVPLSADPSHDQANPFSLLSLETLETPPVSPVESLSGDIENLSLSPALSDSPSPPIHPHNNSLSALLDGARYLRLPIFESLRENI